MNANELADELENVEPYAMGDELVLSNSAAMLRRLQAENETLKAENERLFTTMLDMALEKELRRLKEQTK